jgi:hypothetical protein
LHWIWATSLVGSPKDYIMRLIFKKISLDCVNRWWTNSHQNMELAIHKSWSSLEFHKISIGQNFINNLHRPPFETQTGFIYPLSQYVGQLWMKFNWNSHCMPNLKGCGICQLKKWHLMASNLSWPSIENQLWKLTMISQLGKVVPKLKTFSNF